MLLALDSGWSVVLAALLGSIPATIAALGTWHNYRMLKTPSKKPIGAQTESANALSAVTLANLVALMQRHGQPQVPHDEVLQRADDAVNSLPGEPPSATLGDG